MSDGVGCGDLKKGGGGGGEEERRGLTRGRMMVRICLWEEKEVGMEGKT